MTKRQQKTLIFMCWLIYSVSYMGRYSYNSNVVPMASAFGKSETELGWAMSLFFFAYGAGQIINGILCKFYNTKYVLSLSLISSSVINAVIFIGVPFDYIKYLWLINGISQSVLWTSLLMTISKNLDEKHIKLAILVIGTTVSVGTFLSYGLSAMLALFGGWRFSFLISALVMTVVGITWFTIYGKITLKKGQLKEEQKDTVTQEQGKNNGVGFIVYTLIVFGMLAVITNLVKDGLNSWISKILFDQYHLSESLSIILTMALPVVALFGNALAVNLVKKLKVHNVVSGLLFSVVTVLTFVVTLLFKTPYWYLVLAVFSIVFLFVSSSNSLVTSIIPLTIKSKANSGFIGGILNGCCYAGSTISSVGLGAIKEAYGSWTPIFTLFIILGAFAVVLNGVCLLLNHFRAKSKMKKV